jgi:hypothetical protein
MKHLSPYDLFKDPETTLIATHIEVDRPSLKTGVVYSLKCLERLCNNSINVEGKFGALVEGTTDINERNDPPGKIRLVGFDILNDRLYIKIMAEAKVIDIIDNELYSVKFMTDPFKISEDGKVHHVLVRGVLLEKSK